MAIPTDGEIWALVNEMLKRGPELASALGDYFGAEYKPVKKLNVSRREKEIIVRQVSRYVKIANEISIIKREDLEKPRVRRRFRSLTNQMLRLLVEREFPRGEDELRWQKWTYWWQTMPPEDLKFVRRTKYTVYHKILLSLANSIYYAGRRVSAENFFADFQASPDARALVQTLVGRRWTREATYLDEIRHLDKRAVERLVTIYHLLAGIFEKSVTALVGLVEVDRNGASRSFADLKRRQLNANLLSLRSDGRFAQILQAFDKTIRNSLAHQTWSISPSKKVITFNDLGKQVEVGFKEFLKKTRELASVTFALVELRTFLAFVQFDDIDRKLSRRRSKSN